MLSHPTHERRISLGLPGMAKAFEDQRRSPDIAALSFEERIGLMVDREAAERDSKRLSTRLKFAALRQNAVVPRAELTSDQAATLDQILQGVVQSGTGTNCVTTIGAPSSATPTHAVYLYASNSLSNTVTGEQLNPADGSLKQIQGTPFGGSALPSCIVSAPSFPR